MEKASPFAAETLRKQFRAIPKEQRDARQAFSIRIWRGLSWLERAEQATDTPDDKFIPLWIAFNAIYGQGDVDDGGNGRERPGDHATWQAFVAQVVRADGTDILGDLLRRNRASVLRLLNEKYLFRPFWNGDGRHLELRQRDCKYAVVNLPTPDGVTGVMQMVFERLYVLRAQVFHGAATRGSKLNRRPLRTAAEFLSRIVPAMIAVMLAAGPDVDWGEVCFPPMEA